MKVSQLPKAVREQLKQEGYRKRECGWKVLADIALYAQAKGMDGRWGGGTMERVRPFAGDVCRTESWFMGQECQTVFMGTATAIAALWGYPVPEYAPFAPDTNGGIVADWLEESGLYDGPAFQTLLGILRGDIR